MSIVASLSLLFGIVLGLRFNVRAVFAVCLVVLIGGIVAALGGFVAAGEAALFAVSVAVALQVGYFVSMVIGAMHLADTPEETTAQRSESRERFEMPRM